jgi:hypothetical protein
VYTAATRASLAAVRRPVVADLRKKVAGQRLVSNSKQLCELTLFSRRVLNCSFRLSVSFLPFFSAFSIAAPC